MKILLTFLLTTSLAQPSQAEELGPKVIRWDEIAKLVQDRNLCVQSANKSKEAQLFRTGHLSRSFYPEVEAHTAQEAFKTGMEPARTEPLWGVGVSVNLYRGGQDKMQERILQNRFAQAQASGSQALRSELRRARELYWTILFQVNLINLIEEASELNQKNLEAAQRRISAGVATEADRVEFEMQGVALKQELARLRTDLEDLHTSFGVVLGLDGAATAKDELSHTHAWETELADMKVDLQPELKKAQLEVEETKLQKSLARRSWYPKLDAYAGYNQLNRLEERDYPDAKDRTESVIGLKLVWSLSDGIQSASESRALLAEHGAKEKRERLLLRETESDIENQKRRLKTLHGLVHEAEENVERGRRYLKITLSEYARGVKNSPDVLDAADKFIAFKRNRIEILRDFQLIRAKLLSLRDEV